MMIIWILIRRVVVSGMDLDTTVTRKVCITFLVRVSDIA
jgi:hypothetical protein